ncbi:MAG: oxidoreductase [Verrucomicrobiales bacterium]|nr:oxidoreductase [Verrucomicrobiales bacterium]|tara:strand:+ start:6096 stop:7367 length:1272 start_codon:yes stop_codon:yes gene_type:complete
MNRRNFLISALASSSPFYISKNEIYGKNAPSNKIAIGMIGTGNHGIHRNLNMFLRQKDAQIVAVCDVFKSRMLNAQSMVNNYYKSKGCSIHSDFREILDRDDIDAVMISTPDHWHSLMSAMAIRRGKDVICEKPTLTVAEGRYLSDLVKKTGKVFQTSTEDRSLFIYHRLAEVVRNGRIGKLEKIKVTLPAGKRFPNENPISPPTDLDYDLWLGPAPFAPYTKSRTKQQHWRHVWDYSGGKFSDWGMHQLDTAQWANDTERTGPVSIHGKGTVNEGSMYNTFVDYEINYTYSNGVKLNVKSGGTSIHFFGSEGWCGSKSWDSGLEASNKNIVKDPIPENGVHLFTCKEGEHRNFLDCVKSRNEPYFPAEIGHRCATLCHLGNISMRLDQGLDWNPETEKITDNKAASSMLSREMRKPWNLEKS